jgi:hypothetical protein
MRIRSLPGDDELPRLRDHRAAVVPGRGNLGGRHAADAPGVSGDQRFHIASSSDSTRTCAERDQMIVPAGRMGYPV